MTHKCRICGDELIIGYNWFISHKSNGMYACKKCYYKITNRQKHQIGKVKPYSENTMCASYLGVHVAERVLAMVFKDVKTMPYGYSGYDFICNKGKKIDVKSGCIVHQKQRSDKWIFAINKNNVADYFLCIAFDDRTNLNPTYIWLLPSNKFKNLITASISKNRLSKWDIYKLNVDEVVQCCNELKSI